MASTSASFRQAFVLTPDALRRLATLLSQFGTVSFKAKCADEVERDFADIDAVIGFANIRSREIRRLGLSASPAEWRPGQHAALSFSAPRSLLDSSVDLSITAESDELVVTLRQDLLALVNERRPWYGRIATFDLLKGAIVLGVAVLMGLFVGIAMGKISVVTGQPNDQGDARDGAKTVVIAVGIVAALLLIGKFRDRVFPVAVFVIGEGADRWQTLERVQWGLVLAFFVSVAASVFATFIR